MSRGDGFRTADIDTGLLDDAKMRALWRRLRGSGMSMADAVVVYVAVMLASWRTGERVTADDATPHYVNPDGLTDLLAEMAAVGLLDSEYRIPLHVWARWYGPAYVRTEAKRGGGRIAGLMAHGMTREEAIEEALRRQSQAMPELSPELAGPVPLPYLSRPDPSSPGPSSPAPEAPAKKKNGAFLEEGAKPLIGNLADDLRSRGHGLPDLP